MSRILHISDIHLERSKTETPTGEWDYVFATGDICENALQAIKWLDKIKVENIIYIPGNHESAGFNIDEHFDQARELSEKTGHVRFLNNDILKMDNTLIYGGTFWTGFELYPARGIDLLKHSKMYMPEYSTIFKNKEFLRPEQTLDWHRKHLDMLKFMLSQEAEYKFVLTHHAPSKLSVDPHFKDHISSNYFANDYSYLLEKTDMWFHGHMHHYQKRIENGCFISCNPRGYHDKNEVPKDYYTRGTYTAYKNNTRNMNIYDSLDFGEGRCTSS
jgi:predicted phosphodiesterase